MLKHILTQLLNICPVMTEYTPFSNKTEQQLTRQKNAMPCLENVCSRRTTSTGLWPLLACPPDLNPCDRLLLKHVK